MPTSFKRQILVKVYTRTPASDLIFCDACGGLNAMGRVAVNIECTVCDGTGYLNYYTIQDVPAYYIPGGIKRWDVQRGGVVYAGEAGLKVSDVYEDTLRDAEFIEFNGIKWQFSTVSDPGDSFGQRRLLLALNRKE